MALLQDYVLSKHVDDIVVSSLDLDVWIKLRLSYHHTIWLLLPSPQIIPPTCPLKNPQTGSDKVSEKLTILVWVLNTIYLTWSVKGLAKRGPVKGVGGWRAKNEIEEKKLSFYRRNLRKNKKQQCSLSVECLIFIVILLHYQNIKLKIKS